MNRHVRIRCPICGMLSWQSRLDKYWKFEVIIQHIKGRGKGRGFSNTYYHPETEEGVWLLKLAIIDKMKAVVEELEGELRHEKHEVWAQKWREGEYAEARMVSSTYHTEFSDIGSGVEGLPSQPGITVFLLPVTAEEAEVLVREFTTPPGLSLPGFVRLRSETEEEEAEGIATATPSEGLVSSPGRRRFSFGSLAAAERKRIGTVFTDATVEEGDDEQESDTGVDEDYREIQGVSELEW